MSTEYEDFAIEVKEITKDEYAISVRSASVGETDERIAFPLTDAELDRALLRLENAILRSAGRRRKQLSPEEEAAQAFGCTLFDFLLPGEVRALYRQCQQRAEEQGKGVRLKLHIQSPFLAGLPWEFLYDTRKQDYICLDPDTPLVRYLDIPQIIRPLTVTPPLRILGMVVSPKEYSALAVEEEKERIERALQPLKQQELLELNWLEGQTWGALQREMRRGPWHVFHFIGHGSFNDSLDEGLLVFADEQGQADTITATQLNRLLARQKRSLRLVLLNACEGARGSPHDLFASTAATLIRGGLPAVLTMQYEITDEGATTFARTFYEAVSDGLAVDTAVADGRNAINLRNKYSLEWGTPVLHMRASNGILFEIGVKPREAAPSRQVQQVEEIEPESAPQEPTELEKLSSSLTIDSDVVIGGDHIEGDKIGGDQTKIGSIRESMTAIGDNSSITHIVNHYRGDSDIDEEKVRRQITDYLIWVSERFGVIEMRGISHQGESVVRLDLETVYVPLTAEHWGCAEEAIEMNEVLKQGSRLIITGAPGGGKTTVLQHIAWVLANAIALDRPQLAQEKLGLEVENGLPLPLFVPLSAYAQRRRSAQNSDDPHQNTLATFISRYLITRQSGLDLPDDFFARLLDEGRSVILLLDGLDEVSDEHERVALRQAIEDLVVGRKSIRLVVTCRIAAYRGRTALGQGFQYLYVQALDDKHVTALIQHAYRAVYQDEALSETKTAELVTGIHDLERERRLRLGQAAERLIDSPLLVRMLLLVHLSHRRLPEHRVELYLRATETMLWPEYTLDEEAAEQIGRAVGGSPQTHRELVQHLAFVMHQRGPQQGREIEEEEVRQILGEVPEFIEYIYHFCALTRLRGTLLVERLGTYHFIHLAFQEFLAARYLVEVKCGQSGIEAVARFFEEGAILESWWREPALLVTGYLSLTSPRTARQFVQRLAQLNKAKQWPPVNENIELAGLASAATALLEWLPTEQTLREEVVARIDQQLTSNTEPARRAEVGSLLGRLGDPRPGVGLKDGLPDIEWIEIDAGPFVMGSADEQAIFGNEKPQFTGVAQN
ncbi:CHAT domain-containing protein [Chloroflexi bacterium TSY]|nr:CHAT domain-containing protein [Chloroflexi bacterium TSY]